jgi:crossover junction endodeoxyribonuclease RuvC
MPRILGIDPGIRHTGFGVVDAEGSSHRRVSSGVLNPDPAASLAERLLHLDQEVTQILEITQPDFCALENVFYHKNPKSMMILGQAQAACIIAAARAGVPVDLYAPREVKLALTGQGSADKEQVRFMVERILGETFQDKALDETDALAVAICHAGRRDAKRLEVGA